MSDFNDIVFYLAIDYKNTDLEDVMFQIAIIFQVYLCSIIAQLESKYSIDTADGVWLDYVGYRLGVFERPSILNDGIAFGFEGVDTSRTFGQAPFVDASQLQPINDEYFRAFLKVRAQQLITDVTAESMREALLLFFEDVTVIDNYNMTMSIVLTTDIPLPVVEAVLKAGIVPKPVAVKIFGQIVPLVAFGFDGDPTSRTFGQASFVSTFSL